MKPAIAVLAFVCAILTAGVIWIAKNNFPEQISGGAAAIGEPFKLVSSDGTIIDSAKLKGAPYAVFFGFTNCPEVCPTTLYDMTTALKALGREASGFRLLFITVDPDRDTAEKLKDYLSSFGGQVTGLVPDPDNLPGLARAFRVIYEKVPTSDGGYTMNHTATVFLFNRSGEFAGTISFGERPETRLGKIRRLVQG